jgi:hypothetical protein
MGSLPVRGTVADRPWGKTLGALGVEERSVRLILRSDDKVFDVVFDRGVIVDASSPLAVDSMLRVALKSHPMSKLRSEELKYALAKASSDDELEIVTRMLNLTPDQGAALHRALVTQRAARTFAIDEGEYEIEPRYPSTNVPDGVDVRCVIYIGARMNLSTDRMRIDLLELGKTFRVKPTVVDELDRFGFAPAERRVVGALRVCSSIAELEAKFREVDSRAAHAVVYALASCGGLEPLDVAPVRESDGWDFDEASEIGLAFNGAAPAGSDAVPVPLDDEQTVPLAIDQSMLKTFPTHKATTVRPSALSRHEVIELIRELIELLDRGGDHFALLDVSVDAPVEDIHAAYVERSRHLSRQRLAELEIVDDGLLAPRLLAQLAIAFTTLTDRRRRSEYIASLAKAPGRRGITRD